MAIQAEGRVPDVAAAPASLVAHPMRDPVVGRAVRVVQALSPVDADVLAVAPAGAPRLGSQVSRVKLHH